MDNVTRPLLIDVRKYHRQPYYSNPQLHPDDQIEIEKEAYENELKQYPFHEDLVRMSGTGMFDRWEHIYQKHVIGATLMSFTLGYIFAKNFYGKFYCRRLFLKTSLKGFFIMQTYAIMHMAVNERFQIQNQHKFKQPNEQTRHYQELTEKYNMYQDVQRIKTAKWPTKKEFNKKLSEYNLRVRAKKEEFLIEKLRNA